jgi:hypothetical protein
VFHPMLVTRSGDRFKMAGTSSWISALKVLCRVPKTETKGKVLFSSMLAWKHLVVLLIGK